jgi:hypothetical protein
MRDLQCLAAALAAALTACSGGGHDDSIPAGTCRRAAVPSTGPGDTLSYFPAEVGRTWTYRDESTGGNFFLTVSGTQAVGAETASVFTTTGSGAAPVTELVVKRPAGVYVLSESPPVDPPFDQLYPSLVLPLPVAPMPETEQATCRALDVGDLDGDGKADHADVTVTLRVFSVTETATIAAGSFVDVAHVQTLARIKATATSAGSLDVVATQDDWYAKEVGRVNSLVTITIPAHGVSESATTSLESWTEPPLAALVAAPLVAPGAEEARPAARLEGAALRLVRSSLAARR